jgi:hypothetical protein
MLCDDNNRMMRTEDECGSSHQTETLHAVLCVVLRKRRGSTALGVEETVFRCGNTLNVSLPQKKLSSVAVKRFALRSSHANRVIDASLTARWSASSIPAVCRSLEESWSLVRVRKEKKIQCYAAANTRIAWVCW